MSVGTAAASSLRRNVVKPLRRSTTDSCTAWPIWDLRRPVATSRSCAFVNQSTMCLYFSSWDSDDDTSSG